MNFETVVFWFCLADLLLPLLAWYLGDAFDRSSATLFFVVLVIVLALGSVFFTLGSEPERVFILALGALSVGLSVIFFGFGRFKFAPNAFWMRVLTAIWTTSFKILNHSYPESQGRKQRPKGPGGLN